MEQAIQKAGRSRYGQDRDIRANIDRKNGAITLERVIEVVEEVEEEAAQMTLADAQKVDASLNLGDFIREPLPPLEFGRIAAQTAKQVISQRVRDAERARQFQEYKDRVGEIVVGTIKRAEGYSVSVDLGRAEGVIGREEMIPRELLRQGDRVRAYIKEVREDQEAHRFSSLVQKISSPYSPKKCLKSMMVLLRSRMLFVKLEAVQKSLFIQMIQASIPLAPVLVCAAMSKRLSMNCRVKKLRSFHGQKTRLHLR